MSYYIIYYSTGALGASGGRAAGSGPLDFCVYVYLSIYIYNNKHKETLK